MHSSTNNHTNKIRLVAFPVDTWVDCLPMIIPAFFFDLTKSSHPGGLDHWVILLRLLRILDLEDEEEDRKLPKGLGQAECGAGERDEDMGWGVRTVLVRS